MEVTEFRWGRILAFFLGTLSAILYIWVNPFEFLPAPVAAALASIPVIMTFYGVTERSWKACILAGASGGIGLGIGRYLG